MHKNPLLYSDSSEIPPPVTPAQKETPGKSSLLFYFIILANSLLVLFVLGLIWFLFLKSPDLQIKKLSNSLFGSDTPTEAIQQTIAAPKIQIEATLTPTQQEKDEIQQAKLKQMRERQELAAEKEQLKKMRAKLENQKISANEAKLAIESLQNQEGSTSQNTVSSNITENPAEIEQTRTDALPEPSIQKLKITNPEAKPANSTKKLDQPTTQSQMDLIMKELSNQ